jgi:membrane protease YdiL (CAAX protease family)
MMEPFPEPRPASPPSVWPVFAALGVALVLGFYLSVLALHLVAAVREGAHAFGSDEALLRASATFPGLIAAALGFAAAEAFVVLWALRHVSHRRERIRIGPTRASPGVLAAMIGCMLLLSYALDGLISLAGLGDYGALGAIKDLFGRAGPAELALGAAVVGLGAGTMEEIFFRGYLQTALVARWGAGRGILVASLCFGFAHLDDVQGPMAVFLGLYLGAITEWSGSIRPAIACHVVNNAFAAIAAALLPLSPSPSARAASIAVAVALLALGTRWIRRRLR